MLVTFDSKSHQSNKTIKQEGGTNSITSSVGGSPKDFNGNIIGIENKPIRIIDSRANLNKSKLSKRSKKGCITCKIRKKKCDETRPNCSDCFRLNKNCIWVDDNMSDDDIRELKDKVEMEESMSKLRKRKCKTNEEPKIPLEGDDGPSLYTEFNTNVKLRQNLFNEETLEVFKLNSPPDTFKRRKTENVANGHNNQENNGNISFNSLIQSPNSKGQILNNKIPLRTKNEIYYDDYLQFSLSNIRSILNEEVSSNEKNNDRNDDKALSVGFSNNLTDVLPSSPEGSLNDYIYNIKNFYIPSPTPSLSVMPDIPYFDPFLYNYYVEVLSNKASISPHSQNESNSYQKVFLPLAQKDKGVLYAILAWSAFHLGGKWVRDGLRFGESALSHLSETLKSLDEADPYNRQAIISNLATLLILCSVEICRGDVKNWSVYLNWGWKLLCKNGGILNFNASKEEYWLVSNFAYHDILASRSTRRATYFPSEQYDIVFEDVNGYSKGNLNPLLGVCKTLYKIIGDISMLSLDLQKRMENGCDEAEVQIEELDYDFVELSSPESVSSDLKDTFGIALHKVFSKVAEKSKRIEADLDKAKPESDELVGLTLDELELQLTLFEAFQLSAKLYLKQAVLKCNPSMLECRILQHDLLNCLDVLLGTPVQSSLVFPIFIAGVHCITPLSRDLMRARIKKFIDLYGPWNVQRVGMFLEIIWERYNDGNTVIDWHSLLDELEWDISFA